MFSSLLSFTWSAESDLVYISSVSAAQVLQENFISLVEDLGMFLRENLNNKITLSVWRKATKLTLQLKYPFSRSDLLLVSARPTATELPGSTSSNLSENLVDSALQETVSRTDIFSATLFHLFKACMS